MATIPTPFRLRQGRFADVSQTAVIYSDAFRNDHLVEILFPGHRAHPKDLTRAIQRMFQSRYWTPGYRLTVLVDDTDRAVGFTWWRHPLSSLSLWDRWLSPAAWFAPLIRSYFKLRNYLFPIRTLDENYAGQAFGRVLDIVNPQIMTTERRKNAAYLSTLAVLSSLQGKGLGALLLRDGLEKVDRAGKAAWLIGVTGVEKFYNRFGFVEVAHCRVADLAPYEGGAVMFRE